MSGRAVSFEKRVSRMESEVRTRARMAANGDVHSMLFVAAWHEAKVRLAGANLGELPVPYQCTVLAADASKSPAEIKCGKYTADHLLYLSGDSKDPGAVASFVGAIMAVGDPWWAFKQFEHAAELGMADAMLAVGLALETGDGTFVDVVAARECFAAAARLSDNKLAPALHCLALPRLIDGNGFVPPDLPAARQRKHVALLAEGVSEAECRNIIATQSSIVTPNGPFPDAVLLSIGASSDTGDTGDTGFSDRWFPLDEKEEEDEADGSLAAMKLLLAARSDYAPSQVALGRLLLLQPNKKEKIGKMKTDAQELVRDVNWLDGRLKTAMRLFQRAEEVSCPWASLNLIECRLRGIGDMPKLGLTELWKNGLRNAYTMHPTHPRVLALTALAFEQKLAMTCDNQQESLARMVFTCWRGAEEAGCADAAAWLARTYALGIGCPSEPRTALLLFRRAEHLGSLAGLEMGADLALGAAKQQGAVPGEARRWLERAAEELGSTKAMCRLAELTKFGEDGPFDLVASARWYRRAADLGSLEAIYRYGIFLLYDSCDRQSAYEWLRISAEHDDPLSLWYMAVSLPPPAYEGPGETAEEQSRRSLEESDRAYPFQERAVAIWRLRALQSGDKHACSELSYCMRRGLGTPKDTAEADHWKRVAANVP